MFLVCDPRCNLILHIHVVINWQLSKQGIRWQVSPDRIAGLVIDPLKSIIFEDFRWQVTSFQTIAGSSSFFQMHWKYVVFISRTIKILISNWLRTRKFSQLLQAGKAVDFWLSRLFCYSQLICLLSFWLRNAPLVKVIGNPILNGIVFKIHLAWCVRGLKSLKRFWPFLMAFGSCISTGKPE